MRSVSFVTCACVIIALSGQTHGANTTLNSLGFLPGHDDANYPVSMTDDASTILGWSVDASAGQNDDRLPYIWRNSTGIAPLSDLMPGTFDSIAISGDGSAIFGSAPGAVYRHTSSGVAPLFSTPAGTQHVLINGSSRDGNALTGTIYLQLSPEGPLLNESFVWRSASGLEIFTDGFNATNISGDGSVLIGTRYFAPANVTLAYRRAADGSETPLSGVGGELLDAAAASFDGGSVAGGRYVWNSSGAVHDIGRLPNQNDATSSLDVSASGVTVVGYAEGTQQSAFLWDAEHGIRSVYDVLMAQGVDVSGRWLQTALLVSEDGSVVVGGEVLGNSRTGAWIATAVPEPATWAMAVGGIVLIGWRRAQTRRR